MLCLVQWWQMPPICHRFKYIHGILRNDNILNLLILKEFLVSQ